jgi:hypothetical protein
MKIYNILGLVIFLVVNMGFLSAFGKSTKEIQAELDREVENALVQNYLGMKFISLVKTDAKKLPKISEFISKIKECNFKNDQFLDRTSAFNCSSTEISPGVSHEDFHIEADNYGASVIAVHFSPNAIVVPGDDLRLFDELPGVTMVNFECKHSPREDLATFYIILKDGVPKFTIKERYSGGSLGGNIYTSIYFGLVKNNCKKIAAFEDLDLAKIRKDSDRRRLIEKQKQEKLKKIELKKETQRREVQRLVEQHREEQAQTNALKIPDNLDYSGLSTKDKKYAEALKEVAFCTGYTKEAIPNASLNSCGIVGDDIASNIRNVASCTTALWKQEHIKLQKIVQSFSSDPFFYGNNQNEYYSVYITGVFAFRNRFSKTSEYEYANEFCRVKMEKMLERANKLGR